jgi:hypothetical protein
MNSHIHSSTGYTPAELVYGTRYKLDNGFFVKPESNSSEHESITAWKNSMWDAQEIILAAAAETLKASDAEHMLTAPKEEELTIFPVGSYVLAEHPKMRGGGTSYPKSKLNTKLRGPLRVDSIDGSNYTLWDPVKNGTVDMHITRLRPYLLDPLGPTPLEVAARDAEEFIIDEVKDHSGNPNNKTQMKFLTSWVGYGPEEDRWQSWGSMKNTSQLHKYLRENNLEKLLGKRKYTTH